ncbi:hypothetical protein CFP56_027016 [Quercus suber]|uniref:DUF4283 domain-containing protein n=1 Tax=Quercus suber TaxID=58331 RepID=A0AAW0JY51_QUESU
MYLPLLNYVVLDGLAVDFANFEDFTFVQRLHLSEDLVQFCLSVEIYPCLPLTVTMNTLENMWNKLSLLDSKENSVQCSEDSLARPSLAAKFLTKRLTNIESVARTSKPLWRTQREFKIKDMGENLTFLKFENECDLERVLEHEPWTYDNHLVIFEKVLENVPISALPFKLTTIWVQIHDLPVHCMNPATRDSIGNSLGTVLQMTDSEEEGGKGNCLRCGQVTHDERDSDMWLCSKQTLKKEDQ